MIRSPFLRLNHPEVQGAVTQGHPLKMKPAKKGQILFRSRRKIILQSKKQQPGTISIRQHPATYSPILPAVMKRTGNLKTFEPK
jgi:hypothetical protein